MEKHQLYFLLIIFFILLFYSCDNTESPTEINDSDISTKPQKEWTFLLYDDADFKDAYDPLDDFSSRVSSSTEINYLVLRDKNNGGAEYFNIDKNHNPVLIDSLGELNMGDKSTLENYINFAKHYFPAKRYIIAFYDHGGGWMGTCWDMSNNDNLTASDLSKAISATGDMDLILFTAPCLMGSLETAYQVRNSVKFYIGSENLSGFIIWKDILANFDKLIKNNATLSSRKLSEEIIKLHNNNIQYSRYGSILTMSAIDLSKIDNTVNLFNRITEFYNTDTIKFKDFPFENVKQIHTQFLDFKNLLEELNNFESNDNTKELIQQTIKSFESCIVAECHGDSMQNINGLNIYFPKKIYSNNIYYSPYGIDLDFKNNCSWDDLLYKSLSKENFSTHNNWLNEILNRDRLDIN
jgi:hypothetical protein